jgi:Ca2+-binding EF-hand superfamily protein
MKPGGNVRFHFSTYNVGVLMKPMITLVSIIALSAASSAFAHEHNEDIKGWVDHYFQQVDTEGNGYISKDEFLEHAERKFDAMDTNHDGKLSKQEMMQYKLKEQAEWRQHTSNN